MVLRVGKGQCLPDDIEVFIVRSVVVQVTADGVTNLHIVPGYMCCILVYVCSVGTNS